MEERESKQTDFKKDISYFVGWIYGIYPIFGIIASFVYMVLGLRRMAFQAVACGGWSWLFLIIPLLLFDGQHKPTPEIMSVGVLVAFLWLVMPVVMLYLLRTLKWPTPKPLKMGLSPSIVEIVIVVAIIGILAWIAIPQYIEFDRRVRSSEARVAVTVIHDALVQWRDDRSLGAGTLPSTVETKGKNGKTFAERFPKEAKWLAGGGTYYLYTFEVIPRDGGPPTPQVTARARRPEKVHEPTIVCRPDGTVMGIKK